MRSLDDVLDSRSFKVMEMQLATPAARRPFIGSFAIVLGLLAALSVWRTDCDAGQNEGTEAARRNGLDPATSLESRVRPVPAAVIALLNEPGQKLPKDHPLSAQERGQLETAIRSLTPLHRRTLKERLRTLSFLDGMPNNALTSTVNPKEMFRICDITVNAAVLRQNVSEWLTAKERTCFDTAGSPLQVSIEAGTRFDALVYVLLHEATHVVDSSEGITPQLATIAQAAKTNVRLVTPFIDCVWNDMRLPVARYRDPLREQLLFYSGTRAIPVDRAQAVYESLERTPFVSLYGGRNWFDDLAELVSVYQLTEVLKQPFRIVIRRGKDEVFAYEPMKSELVRSRLGQLKHFYEGAG
jgi:hypothetical protein